MLLFPWHILFKIVQGVLFIFRLPFFLLSEPTRPAYVEKSGYVRSGVMAVSYPVTAFVEGSA